MSDLSELFSRDPLQLTKEDRKPIIERYRQARSQFNLGVKSAGATKKIKGSEPKITDLTDILGDL